MYKLKNIISNVKYHIIINKYDDLIYLKDDTVYANDIPILKGNNVFDFNAYGYTVYIGENGMVHFKNYKDNYQTKFNKSASVSFINENEALLYFGSDDYLKSYVGRLDILNNVFKWKIEGIIGRGLIIKDYLFSGINNTKISKIDLNHPEQPLWQFELSQLGTFYNDWDKKEQAYSVAKIIGIANGQLFVALDTYSHSIIAIDIKTGTLIKKWENIPDTFSANLDSHTQQIFGFGYQNFWTIDSRSHQLNFTDIKQSLVQNQLNSVRSQMEIPVNDTHYLIKPQTEVDNKARRVFDAIALFNKKTLQIDWYHIFDKDTFLGTNIPKMTENNIYQLDNNNILYIFEKELNI